MSALAVQCCSILTCFRSVTFLPSFLYTFSKLTSLELFFKSLDFKLFLFRWFFVTHFHRIKIQQDIIDLQRLKLERQERVIMELKLSKLSEEAREARTLLKEQLKTVIRVGEPKSKAKAKCLQLIGNLQDSDDGDKLDHLQGKAFLVPKFLQNMQERALERSIKHEQAKQRRQQAEAVREAQKTAQEEAKVSL